MSRVFGFWHLFYNCYSPDSKLMGVAVASGAKFVGDRDSPRRIKTRRDGYIKRTVLQLEI